jgi:subtilisin family serine protease
MYLKSLVISIFILSFCTITFAQNDNLNITTRLKKKFTDNQGNVVTGKGVLIGDVDSGIDIFQPMFFFADGGEFDWVDVDNDGVLTFGVDGIDLNKDGKIDNSEILRFIELKDNTWGILKGAEFKKFNPDYDFIYLDKNGNKKRDFGKKDGFSESDPTYGEQLLIVSVVNQNNKINKGEKLIALKTSKVRAVREKDGRVRRRGVDLIETEEDSSGHGTGVAGLILGGHYGIQKLHGIAPDAEIVVSTVKYDYTPRFVRNFPDLINFIKDEKCNILLFEDGEWMWEFMDGSSPEEELQNQMARDGIVVIGGAGNLASGNMHLRDNLIKGESYTYSIDAPAYTENKTNDGAFVSFLWKEQNGWISFTIETPDKSVTPEIELGSGILKTGKYNVFYSREISSKGTIMFKLGFSKNDSGSVSGKWKMTLKPDNNITVDGYVVDVSQGWDGTTHWIGNKITDEGTVTFPCTADSCMAIGAYVVNFGWFDKVGDLANYSGRGLNIDGKMGVDITGPGHTTFTTEKDFGWMTFSGTSSAAPHVVGAAALILSINPKLTHEIVRQIILNSASTDKFTGSVPNTNWGYGKLNIEKALENTLNNYSH